MIWVLICLSAEQKRWIETTKYLLLSYMDGHGDIECYSEYRPCEYPFLSSQSCTVNRWSTITVYSGPITCVIMWYKARWLSLTLQLQSLIIKVKSCQCMHHAYAGAIIDRKKNLIILTRWLSTWYHCYIRYTIEKKDLLSSQYWECANDGT